MKKMLFAALMLALAGCAGAPSSPNSAATNPATETGSNTAAPLSAADAIASAETEMTKAKNMGGLWTSAEDILTNAKAAQAAGDQDKALKLANEALKQARLGEQQAQDSAIAGPNYPAN